MEEKKRDSREEDGVIFFWYKEDGVNPRLVFCAKTESRMSTTYCLIDQHWRTAEVPVGGARTEAGSSGLSFPCSWKRRN